jgi:Mg-chelatase subunit ChlD
LLNTFGPNTQSASVSATQYAQWLKDVEHFERAFGYGPGELRGKGSSQTGTGKQGGDQPGSGFEIGSAELQQALAALDQGLIKRMALREVLQDDNLARQLTPSIGIVEQLLHDKANLSGKALEHAKRLIREYVDEMAEVLRLQVAQVASGKIDRSVPPKRVFRNLDLDRTIWKNLTNWNPDEQRLYVDRLYFKQTARKKLPTRLIVLVDQSGSMVDAMVQCTILASIFAGLPHVDVHLLAFDTRVLDLTDWVSDPFEVLMRTQLGGGTHINFALQQAAQKVEDPRRTAIVLISDFYEGGSNQVLLDSIKALRETGVHFIPVGSVTSSGYVSINDWFRTRLKDMGTPILTGSPSKLIFELKKLIVL